MIVKQSYSIGLLILLQAIVQPAMAVASLYGITVAFGVQFDQEFVDLSLLVFGLSVVLLPKSEGPSTPYLASRWPFAAGILIRWMLLLGMLLVIGYATKFSQHYSRRAVLTWALMTPVVLIVCSLTLRELMRQLLMAPDVARRVVFAGCNEISASLANRLTTNVELGMSVTGFFDDRNPSRLNADGDFNLLGTLPELPDYVRQNNIDLIFISLPLRHVRRVMDLLDELRDTTASIYYVPDIFVFDLIQARTSEIMGLPVVALCETPFHGIRGVTKRITDVIISSIVLMFLSPLMLAIAGIVKFSSPGPIIFKQRRYGLDGRQIVVYKFRTMNVTEDGGQIMQATRTDIRITPMGRFLRRYSLDELPQLINVLQGRMSLVGPRPHAVAHNEEYRKLIKGYMMRHKVLPGITGLAQVNGCRGETIRLEDMQARVDYDLDYLRHWSPLLDLKILLFTVLKLFRDKRAY